MIRTRQFTVIHYLGAGLLLVTLTLCAGCAAGSSSTAPAVNAAGNPPPPKAIEGIGEKPVSMPDAFPTEGGVPLYVHHWDGGSYDPDGEIVGWEWNFGDAAPGEPAWQDYTDSEGDAWHWYTKPGIKVAHLRVTDNDGNKDVAFVHIEMKQGNNANPIAVASADPISGNAPLTVDFSATGSYDPDGTIVLYEWDFGEGYGFETCGSLDGGTTHVFEAGGVYTAVLRVTDDDGAESMDSVDIDVNTSPTAVASADPTSGDEPLTVNFSAAGSYDPDGTIVMYEWDFGEGGGYEDFTDADGAADYEYTTEGMYTAVLRVTDDDGAESMDSVEITVDAPLNLRGDWWMFGREPTHNGRSPFTGPTTSSLKWYFVLPGISYASPAIAADGTIYIGSYGTAGPWVPGELTAINPDGTLKWSYTTGSGIHFSTPAIGSDGTVYVGCLDGKLYAINANGGLKWTYATSDMVARSSPAIGSDGTIYVGSWDNKLYAIDADGNQRWSYTTGDDISSSPAIGSDGTVYVGSNDHKLYAINPNGSLKWSYTTGDQVRSSPAIGADGTVYVGSWDNNLYAIDADGDLKWSYTTGDNVESSPAIDADGTIYVGSYDKKLYAIYADGTLKWGNRIGGGNYVQSSPAIDAEGTIYYGGPWYDSSLYAVNSDGTLKWYFHASGNVTSPVIGSDGTIYTSGIFGPSWILAIGPGEGV